MSYSGWVQYRRGIMEHVLDGRLTGLQHYALSQLILMADASRGGYNVNAPILCYWCGYVFNLDTAERILKALHEKQYVWYRGLRGSKHPQPYWVNKYRLTVGPFAMRMTNLSQLFDKSMISQEDVCRYADQHADDGADEDADHDADNYKKEKREWRTKTKALSNSQEAQEAREAEEARGSIKKQGERDESTRSANGAGAEAHEAEEAREAQEARDAPNHAETRPKRFRWIPGDEPYYIDADTGQRLRWSDAVKMVQSGNAIEVN